MEKYSTLLLFLISFCQLIEAIRHIHPFYFSKNYRVLQKRSVETNDPLCSDDELMVFLAEITVLTPESIIKLSLAGDLKLECNRVSSALEKAANYLKRCPSPTETNLYLLLFKGVQQFYHKICVSSSFLDDFYKSKNCLQELRNDFDDCDGPPDWNEFPDSDNVCAAYKAISDCYYIKAATVCGYLAADTIKELLMTVLDETIITNCPDIASNPEVSNPMPDSYLKDASKEHFISLHDVGVKTESNVILIPIVVVTIIYYVYIQYLWK